MATPPNLEVPAFALRLALEARAGGPLPDWERVQVSARTITAEAGEVIFEAGVYHPYVYLVQRGVVELCGSDERGRPVVSDFGTEGQVVADLRGLGSPLIRDAVELGLEPRVGRIGDGARTIRSLRAIEPSVLVGLDVRVVEPLARQHPAWSLMLLSMLMNYTLRLELREFERRSLPAEERYQLLLRERPHLVARLRQKDLARILDVTEAALSRIVGRVRTELRDARVGH